MKLYGDEGIDLFIVPIGDNFTMGPDDAFRAIKFVNPKLAIPYHYNTWPLIEQNVEAWAKRVETNTDTKTKLLSPGESLTL